MLCILGSSVLTSQFLNCHVACVVYLKLSRYTVGSNMLGEQFVYGHRDESLQMCLYLRNTLTARFKLSTLLEICLDCREYHNKDRCRF
ncbi:hypothetical protein T4A_2228 [Trichinella pseudospiralis]|uniref:Uncharacterized protein n=1 Tax=Trichinella pseudospiralis TaxID=6337 RepID=A0A0V1G0A6_TRIPS|nr:hypothetical protein T4A_2228 [Trichinella pseudospiralis]KRY91735.1 hypothetical protein T4D_9724 [Trichinella pseudospiralis]